MLEYAYVLHMDIVTIWPYMATHVYIYIYIYTHIPYLDVDIDITICVKYITRILCRLHFI